MNIFKNIKESKNGSTKLEINLFPNKSSNGMQGGSSTNFNGLSSGWNWRCYGIKNLIEIRITTTHEYSNDV